MFDFIRRGVTKLYTILNRERDLQPDDLKALSAEVASFLASDHRRLMIKAFEYYNDHQDIIHHKRMVIGKNGVLEEAPNLPNCKLLDNQYAIHTDKKANYLFGKPFAMKSDNEEYIKLLEDTLGRKFKKKLGNVALDMMRCGVGYLYPYYKDGKLEFMRLKPYEIKVYYADDEKEEIDFFFRYYKDKVFTQTGVQYIDKVDVFTKSGIKHYRYSGGGLIPETEDAYVVDSEGQAYSWDRVPLVVFRYNSDEQILLRRVKPLQDAINLIMSTFENNMLEDTRTTILILENYDGTSLDEFRQNLMTYGAVKVRSLDGARGGVSSLQVQIDTENYRLILDTLKKALIKNMKSVDVDALRSGEPNQMNIQSMFIDIDQDANGMEAEAQSSMEDLLWFVDRYYLNTGKGDYRETYVDFEFNRDLMSDEAMIVDNIVKLVGLVSDETLRAQIPFVSDPKLEGERLKKQLQEEGPSGVAGYGMYGKLGDPKLNDDAVANKE